MFIYGVVAILNFKLITIFLIIFRIGGNLLSFQFLDLEIKTVLALLCVHLHNLLW